MASCKLQDVKKRLKSWEAGFVRENNRKPGKDDIAVAAVEVQTAYKEYAALKQELKQDSARSVNPNQGAWGRDLNAKDEENPEATDEIGDDAKQKDAGFMSKLSKKLYETSGNGNVPKKPAWGLSRSFSQQKSSSPKVSSARFGSSRNNSFSIADKGKVSFKEERKPKKEAKENIVEKCDDRDDITLTSKNCSFLSVLDKVSIKQNTVKNTVSKLDSDMCSPIGILHKASSLKKDLSQKYKFVDKIEKEPKYIEDSLEPSDPFPEENPNTTSPTRQKPNSESNKPEQDSKAVQKDNKSSKTAQQDTKTAQQDSKSKKPQLSSYDFGDFDDVDFDEPLEEENQQTSAPSSRGQKRRASSDAESREDSRKSRRTDVLCNGWGGAEIIPSSGSSRGGKRAAVAQRKRQEADREQWESSGVSEVAWQQDQPNVDMEVNLEQEVAEEVEEQEINVPKKTKPRSVSSKPITNDNFLRLNMKVKSYRRRGGGMTGGKFKRMQWKQKMKARSDSYGDKCFKCGQAGHWASKCKNKAKPKVPNMEEGDVLENLVNDGDFPSLQQAMGMAKGISVKKTARPASTKARKDSKATTDSSQSAAPSTDPAPEDPEDAEDDDLDLEMDIYRSGYEAPEPPAPIEPLYELEEDGSLPEPPAEVWDALKIFGFKDFRSGQKKAVMRILCGLSTLVILSTGSGKSLIYQLSAYLYATKVKAITLVISPLVSLMEDQVTGLPEDVHGACLHTNMTKPQRQKVLDAVTEGRVHFLLVSPEAMTSATNAASLLGSAQLPPIAFVCIDEAHCVSEWSHHFRPSYLRICKVLRENYGVRCMLGLTATATMVTAASVAQHLAIDDYQTSTIRDLPVPSNLLLSASRDEDKDQALLGLLQGDRFAGCGSVIIYCARREQTTRISTLIRTCMQNVRSEPTGGVQEEAETGGKKGKGRSKKKPVDRAAWTAESYHAGLSPAQRKRVQNAFMCGRLRVVVATVAFGMGVDKSDVRGIIHYTMPKSYESYVQEIGRAGRDGKPSHCHVFLDHQGQDSNELKRHIYSNTIDRFVIKKLVKKFFPRCRCKEKHEKSQPDDAPASDSYHRICPGHERAVPIERTVQELDIREEGISTLLCYLELHPKAWLVNLQTVYAICTIQCYGGPRELHLVAQKCPPVAVAIARQQKKGASFSTTNVLEFPVVDVSDSMGWESGPVKRELKLLQWNLNATSGPKKTGVLVTFTDLAFHMRSPGDLDDDEIDEVVTFLHERVQTQETTEIQQLQRLQDTLRGVSHKDVWMCSDRVDDARSDRLKVSLRRYFDEQPELENGQVTMLSFAREYSATQEHSSVLDKVHCDNEDQVRADIRQFIGLYGSEHTLSGRVIARVLHGIPSPCFPAEVWGRARRFWRAQLHVDFNVVRRLATQEMVNMR